MIKDEGIRVKEGQTNTFHICAKRISNVYGVMSMLVVLTVDRKHNILMEIFNHTGGHMPSVLIEVWRQYTMEDEGAVMEAVHKGFKIDV